MKTVTVYLYKLTYVTGDIGMKVVYIDSTQKRLIEFLSFLSMQHCELLMSANRLRNSLYADQIEHKLLKLMADIFLTHRL